jgi:phospholipid N-methyltransferase
MLAEAGLTEQTYLGAAQALTHVAIDVSRIDPIEQQIKEAKRALWGHDIPGFFPTPDELAERLVRLANIRAGMRVLEPSAGWGNIADAVRRLHPDVQLILFEVVPSLLEILNWKGYCTPTVHGHNLFLRDFLQAIPGAISGYQQVDRAIGNPPFEAGQDIDHIKHMYEWLKPGGRLVSICSEGPFFRQDRKSEQFREWLFDHGAYTERLPEGSFSKGERPTNVATRLVIIDR